MSDRISSQPGCPGTRLPLAMNRRRFIAGMAGGVLASSTGWTMAHAQAGPTLRPLRDGLSVISGAGANVVAANVGGVLTLVDGGEAAHAATLTAALSAQYGATRPGVLFNTNWRPEHVGLNAVVREAGGRIIAHENTRLWLGNRFRVGWEDIGYTPRPEATWPNETYFNSADIAIGSSGVRLEYLPQAHTDGDIVIRFPDPNVLVVSDLLGVAAYPVLDYATGGWLGGMVAANRRLLDLADADTLIVPAVGLPQTRAALASQLAMCEDILGKLRETYTSALSLEEFLAADPAGPYRDARGDPGQFLDLAYRGIWGHIRDLGWSIV